MRKTPAPPSADPPDAAQLRSAALAHLSRFAATEAGLARVLLRKIDRWQAGSGLERERAQALAAGSRNAIADIVAHLAAEGTLNDARFAETRARALIRSGRSRRAASAHLMLRGVASDLAIAALPQDDGSELAAALIHARRRRLGPWRMSASSPEESRRDLGSLARAGFPHTIAEQVLRLPRETAEDAINAFRAAL